MHDLFCQLEIIQDQQELRDLGLSEAEVEGYLEFFIDNYRFRNQEDDRRNECSSKIFSVKNVELAKRNG